MVSRFVSLALAVCVAAAVAPTVHAGVDVDFGAAVNINDRTSLFFSISSRYFDRDRATVASYGQRFTNPDDLAVALFLHRHCGRSLDEIWVLRTKGLTWWDISLRYGVPADVWFVPVRRDPGPPYGKAYGYWKKHKQQPSAMRISDVDARNLVAVRLLHDYFGVTTDIAMQWRAGGTQLHEIAGGEYERRHGRSTMPASQQSHPSQGSHPGKGHGRGSGHPEKR